MNNSNYNSPQTRKGKINLLNALITGQMKVNDLKPETIEVWREDKNDPSYMVCLNPVMRITKTDYNNRLQTASNTKCINVHYGKKD